MQEFQLFKRVTADKSNLLERLLKLLAGNNIGFCVIGGVAVSCYAEPMVTLDFDIVITNYQLGRFESLCASIFQLKRSARLIEITAPNSRLRVNVHTDARLADFVGRAEARNVFDMNLPIARIEDVMRAKVWAYEDMTRSAVKRQMDLLDIARLLETNPKLRVQLPPTVLKDLQVPRV